MTLLSVEAHPELLPLLQSLREGGGVVITDHGRPVAFVGKTCPPKPPDLFAFRRAFQSPTSAVSEMAEIRRGESY